MKTLKTQLETLNKRNQFLSSHKRTFTTYESLPNGHLGNADIYSNDVILTLFIELVL